MTFPVLKDKLVRRFCLKTWRIWEMLGLHISPNHFYWPIPDSKDLRRHDFDKKFPLDGIKINESEMLELLKKMAGYKTEYASIHTDSGYASNGDGAVLYGMVRQLKPKKILEVGSGFSTRIAWQALEKNRTSDSQPGEIIAIEPYPKDVLRELADKADNVSLMQRKVETLGEQVFTELENTDILFIDSSHVVKMGNDVHYLYLSVLPKVPVGTIIHIHDIRFPFDYPKDWLLKGKKFWTEQYLLQMFLTFNDNFQILFAGNYMYDRHPDLMAEALVGLDPQDDGWPGCFWIKRIK